MKKNKFKKGHKINFMGDLLGHLTRGNYIYYNHKPQHPGFIQSMTLRTLLNAIHNGMLFTAKEE
jgi:hypothetical protein